MSLKVHVNTRGLLAPARPICGTPASDRAVEVPDSWTLRKGVPDGVTCGRCVRLIESASRQR